MELTTQRLILRKPKLSDWKDILEACKDGSISNFTARVPFPYKTKDAKWFVNDSIKKWNKKESYRFFIELKSENKIIGVLELHEINKFDEKATTGSWINPNYQRKGYMFEAKIAVNSFAFNKLKLNKLETGVFTFNKASNATQKAMGYKKEGTRKQTIKSLRTGKIYDENIFGLLRKDWKKNLPKLKRKLKVKIKN